MAKPKEKTQAKKTRKKPDCRRLSLHPLKPEEAIKIIFDVGDSMSQKISGDKDSDEKQ